MFFRFKKLSAFITGCLASTVIFGYPSQLLAQTNTHANPIQGVTSTTQSPPSNAAEIADAITGINAGLTPIDVGGFSPAPIREHAAFMADLWSTLLDSEYSVGNSYLTTGEWLTGTPSGTLTATNEVGNTVSIDITLSLEILPEQFDSIDQESLDILSSVSARIGMAWTTMSNPDGVNSNILIWWYQWNSPDGVQTAIGPLTTIAQEDIDLLIAVIPLMDGFFDNPLNYNIDEYISGPLGIWSRFRTAVLTVAVTAVAAIVAVAVTAAIIASLPATAPITAVAVAGATLYGVMVGAAIEVVGLTAIAYMNLLDDLEAAGVDTSDMSVQDVLDAARVFH